MTEEVLSMSAARKAKGGPKGRSGATPAPARAGAQPRSDVLDRLRSQAFAAEIARCVPAGVGFDVDRFMRVTETLYCSHEKLWLCDGASMLGAALKCAELGLVPVEALGHAHIAATQSKNAAETGSEYEAQLIPGYRGLIALAMRSGEVAGISSRIVYEKEIASGNFDLYYEGSQDTLIHRPILTGFKGEPALVYCIVRLKAGGFHIETMTADEVNSVRTTALERSPWRKDDNAWVTHANDMWRKTPVRRAMKYLDVQVEQLHAAIALDEGIEIGRSQRLSGLWKSACDRDTSLVAHPTPDGG